jgi:signal transduction histidine kinase
MLPLVGGSRPPRRFSRVLFPLPLRPTMVTNSPSSTVIVTPKTAVTPLSPDPNDFVTSLVSNTRPGSPSRRSRTGSEVMIVSLPCWLSLSISARNLHQRLALGGPADELKDLSATIDDLLTRLERSFQAQRAFVANASHELRTPLALSRAMLSFALTDPELTLESLKATCQDVLDAGTDHEQLIEALLTLARSQQDLEHRETFDLAAITRDVITNQQRNAADQQVAIDAALSPAPVSGDPLLARTLLTNLVDNALRYNVPHGRVNVTLSTPGGRAALTISNSGPEIRADQVDRLLQPFRRLTPDRGHDNDGHGLGLSIVAAIATAHNATLSIRPRLGGGLHVKIEFPAVYGDDEKAPPAADGALATAATMAPRPVLTAWAPAQPTRDPRRRGCRESRGPG